MSTSSQCKHTVVAIFQLLAIQSGATAAGVRFDWVGGSYFRYEFNVVIEESDLPRFDSVSILLGWDDRVSDLLEPMTFEYAPSFVHQLSVSPTPPSPIDLYTAGDLLIGGNRFTTEGFVAPLLIGTVSVSPDYGHWFPWDPPTPIVSSAYEQTMLGFPLSLIANGLDQEEIETVPEPASLIFLAVGAALICRRGHDLSSSA